MATQITKSQVQSLIDLNLNLVFSSEKAKAELARGEIGKAVAHLKLSIGSATDIKKILDAVESPTRDYATEDDFLDEEAAD